MLSDSYLDALASAAPTPGGGSAAALVGATGAALVAMVGRITEQAPRHAERAAFAASLTARADALRARLLAAGQADEAAYTALRAALALPKNTDELKARRERERSAALEAAAEAPLHIAQLCSEVAALAAEALSLGNTHLQSDLVCAVEFAAAAAAAAAANVRVNHRSMSDAQDVVQRQSDVLSHILTATAAASSVVRDHW